MDKSLEYNLVKRIIITLTVVLMLDTIFFLYKNYYSLNKEISKLRNEKIEENKKNISRLVKITIGILSEYNEKVKKGEMPLEKAKEEAKSTINKIRYDSDNYFWIDTTDYINILLPPEKSVEGTSRKDLVDKNGVHFVRELVDGAKTNQNAYVIYFFRKLNQKEDSPKIGYVELFKPWGWVIGTGFYMDDMDKELLVKQEEKNTEMQNFLEISLVKDFLIVLLFILFTINFFDQLKSLLKKIYKELGDNKAFNVVEKKIENIGLHEVTEEIKVINNFVIKRNEELELYEQVIQKASDGIIILNDKKEVIKVNDHFCLLSGFDEKELIGHNLKKIKSNKHDSLFYNNMWNNLINFGSWQGRIWNKNKNGNFYEVWLTISTIKMELNQSEVYLGIASNINSLKSAEAQIQKMAYTDTLTNIANRRFFYETLTERIKSNNSSFIILTLDLDRFKIINDTLGHSIGDKVLVEISSRLKNLMRPKDTFARLGGDEFSFIIEKNDHNFNINKYTQEIFRTTNEPIIINDFNLTVGCSIGGVIFPTNGVDVEELLIKSDIAMFQAKKTGGNRFLFFSDEMKNENDEFLYIESCIKNALKNNLFYLHLQPKVYNNDLILGAEALIRMKTLEGSLLPPYKFIKVAEDTGLIIEIGKWVIEEACKLINKLNNEDINIHIAINISTKQLQDNHLIDTFKETMEKYNISPHSLEIEITESFFLNDIKKAIDILTSINKMGIKIGIDDFGTGFSSLASLSTLPIDYLKIDKSFIDKLGIEDEKELVTAIISIARNLDLDVIAEGVETENQLKIIREHGNIGIQGYYFSKPLEFEKFIEFYKKFKRTI